MKKINKKENICYFLLIIVLLSLFLLVPFIKESTTGPDHELYSSWVDQIRQGDFEGVKFWLVPAVASIFPFSSSISLKLVSVIFFLGLILLTYLIGKEISNEWTGLGAAMLVAFNPLLLREAIQGILDIPVTFFFCLTIYLYLLNIKKQSWKLGSFFIISSILTILVKNTGVFIIPVILGIMFLELFFKKQFKILLWVIPVMFIGIFKYYSQVIWVFKSLTLSKSGLLIYFSWFGWEKILVSIFLVFILLYFIYSAFSEKNAKIAIPSLWTFFYLIGLIVPVSTIVGRHLMPIYPAIILAFAMFIEEVRNKLKLPINLILAGYCCLILFSIIFSIQHMYRFVGV